ncbi:MAG: CvpA family protein [Synergistaceae bacterium]|jgi:membrane protein required for colicin V production|nr:CvpA family protein [Synergistaceae bacterium]
MSAVDIALLAAGIFFVVRGIMKGISGEVISLLGTVGGFFCSIRFYEPFAAILMTNFGMSAAPATILSMLAIFFVIFFGCAMIETLVKKVIKKTSLTVTDKTLGALVGLFKMYVIALLVLVGGFAIQPLTGDAWIQKSRVLSAVSITWPVASDLLDRAGLLPDISTIQEEAREYIIRQAGRAMRDASEDVMIQALSGDAALPSGEITYPDGTEPGAER